ncbi:MAG: DUF1573 domain-containing protein [Pseudomonadota bacterium]|jgi:hypothetical protein
MKTLIDNLFLQSSFRLFAGMLIGAATLFSCVVGRAAAETGPIAKLAEAEYDFGRVMQGHKVVHEFAIQNQGDADLLLQRISPSCGCTAAAVSSSTVKPGGSEKIRVTFDTSGMYGGKTKTVHVQTNDRQNPEVTLKLRGAVVRGMNASPERIMFGEVSQGASEAMRTQEITLSPVEGMDWQVARVLPGSKFLTVAELPGQGAAKRYAVTLLPDAPKGELRERLIVEFKDSAHAAVNIPVTATVLGDLRVTPTTVSFGIISGSEQVERRLKYENSSNTTVAIKSITSSHPAVSGAMVDVEGGKKGVIVVKLDPTKVAGDLTATVQIATDHPQQPILTVSVYGVQAPR